MSRFPTIVLALVAVAVTGCAGPEPRVDFGGKAVPTNVAFGKPKSDAPPSPGTAVPVLQPVPGGVGVVPVVPGFFPVRPAAPEAPAPGATAPGAPAAPPPSAPAAPAAPAACPAQDPLAFPTREATNVVTGEVPEGAFPYRVTGSFTVNGTKTPYSGTDVQTVKRLEADAAGRARYSMSFRALDVPFTVTYAVQQPVEAVPGEIALAATVQDSSDGTGASFRPVEPLRLLQLRAERGASWTEATSDPLTASSATVEGTIVDKARLNACGRPVEAWKAVVTQRIVTPGQDVTATRTLFFGTGYGGLLLGEQVSYTGTAGGDAISGESTTTINVDPGAS